MHSTMVLSNSTTVNKRFLHYLNADRWKLYIPKTWHNVVYKVSNIALSKGAIITFWNCIFFKPCTQSFYRQSAFSEQTLWNYIQAGKLSYESLSKHFKSNHNLSVVIAFKMFTCVLCFTVWHYYSNFVEGCLWITFIVH